ncbi:MAG: MBOAT family protein [Bacteroidia bacterium]|jgi:alginate O-acetyltransferase complex protein AlgI|nr:MBOAT family protein [Bacteroidia bacterium]
MVFSSFLFLVFFLPAFLLIYHLLPRTASWRNPFLLVASFLFYAWGEPRFVGIVLLTTILDYFIVGKMGAETVSSRRKMWLVLSLILNVGLLFYFKYFNFFIENINAVLGITGGGAIAITKILLPAGISFFTFESITYAVDIYRGEHRPLKKFWHYQQYIIFFPKLVAGPIIRYSDMADQITGHVKAETGYDKLWGFSRFCIGLGKKVFIANTMAAQADLIFDLPATEVTTLMAWTGILAYTFQIYFDFSGYSDMAIGLSRILGFRITENFNNPYTAGSITAFWRRWHITLGNWMRNYLYIPLGGNRASTSRLYRNLLLVFLISGFWHGASWNFILWGAFHGVFLILERLVFSAGFQGKFKVLNTVYTFIIVLIGWVLFRTETLEQAMSYYECMFSLKLSAGGLFYLNPEFLIWLVVAAAFSFCALVPFIDRFQEKFFTGRPSPWVLGGIIPPAILIYLLSIVYLAGDGYNPFIYFNF